MENICRSFDDFCNTYGKRLCIGALKTALIATSQSDIYEMATKKVIRYTVFSTEGSICDRRLKSLYL